MIAALVGLLVGLTALPLLHPARPLASTLGTGLGVGALLGFLGGLLGLLSTPEQARRAELSLTAEGLLFDGRTLVRRAEVREGRAWQATDGAHVVLRGGRTVHLVLPTLAEARGLLEALGVDARRKAAGFPIVAPSLGHLRLRIALWLLTLPLAVAIGVVGKVAFGVIPPVQVVLAPYILAIVPLLVPGKLVVGADAVVLRWGFGETRIPIADVASAEVVRRPSTVGRTAVVVRLGVRGEERAREVVVAIPPTMSEPAIAGAVADAQSIVERIEEARLAQGSAVDLAVAARALGHEGLDAAAWLATLRERFGRRGDDYRSPPPLTPAQLLEVAERPDGPPHVRIAAAAAASSHLDAEGKQRLRVAAEATASSDLRAALEAAAEADDDALRVALDGSRQPRDATG